MNIGRKSGVSTVKCTDFFGDNLVICVLPNICVGYVSERDEV